MMLAEPCYGVLGFDERRWSTEGGVMLSGQRDGHATFGSVGLARLGAQGTIRTTIFGRLDVVRTSLDAYSETGSPIWALSYDSTESTTVSGVAGPSAEFDVPKSWDLLVPGARIECRHAFGGDFTQRLGYADIGTADHAVAGDAQRQNILTLGPTLHGVVDQNLAFELEYEFSTDMDAARSQQFRGSVQTTF